MEEILDQTANQEKKTEYFKLRVLLYWSPLAAFIFIFKVMHWPGTSILILAGVAGVTAYTLSAFIRLRGKDILNNFFAVIGLGWILILVGGVLFFRGHPYNENGLILYFILLVVCFGIQELIKAIRQSIRKSKNVVR